jgi:hypothetical protein
MAYELVSDFLPEATPTNSGKVDISSSPNWAIAVFRYKYPNTFRRASRGSFSSNYKEAVEIRGSPLVITSDCISLNIESNKGNFIHSLSAQLIQNPSLNYLSEIMPGDHVMAWIVNSETDYLSLLSKIQKQEPCNGFNDGLKFIGRIHSIGKQLVQQSDGNKLVRYNLSASSFSEFSSSVFYNPLLAEKLTGTARRFAAFALDINNLIESNSRAQGVLSHKIIPDILNNFFNKGFPENYGKVISPPEIPQNLGPVGKYTNIVPFEIGKLLDVTTTNDTKVHSYGDWLQVLIGVQKYNHGEFSGKLNFGSYNKSNATDYLLPQTEGGLGNVKFTGIPLMGSFTPTPPNFDNVTVWNAIRNFLNPSINEMYTTLKVSVDGKILPTLVVRQLPFSTDIVDKIEKRAIDTLEVSNKKKKDVIHPKHIEKTFFSELPRWGIHPSLVKSFNLGRSNALRFNYVHVMGQVPTQSSAMNDVQQFVRNLPILDELDIARSGLLMYQNKVNCSEYDIRSKQIEDWMGVMSDFLMGQHLTVTGSLSLVGIQSPICVGDNVEFDDMILHIESVTHSCSISPGGKSFNTILQLTHGLRIGHQGNDDIGAYAGINSYDARQHEPQTTYDDIYENVHTQNVSTDTGSSEGSNAAESALNGERTATRIRDGQFGGAFPWEEKKPWEK